ncbi:MAG: hypothetical protein AAGA48_17735 [Myxococcota bacterium]
MSAAAINEGPPGPTDAVLGDIQVEREIDRRTRLGLHPDHGAVMAHCWPEALAEDAEALSPVPAAPTHPHWVPIVEAIADDAGLWLVHRTIEGPSLRTFRRRMRPSILQIDAIGRQLIAAVEAAHRLERTIGWLTPGRVWLAAEGRSIAPHLIGVGLPEVLPSPGRYTASLADTPYGAPELADGKAPTRPSDRYALGAVLFHLVTGQAPDATRPPPPPFLEMPTRIRDTITMYLDNNPLARPLDVLAVWTRSRAMATGAWSAEQLEACARLAPRVPSVAQAPLPEVPEVIEEVASSPPRLTLAMIVITMVIGLVLLLAA